MLINMFDTGIESDNLGDHFIMDAVWEAVRPLFPDADYVFTPTHRRARLAEMAAGRRAAFSIVGGTNILKSHMLVRGNWKITPLDYFAWRNVVLLGVGWQQYGGPADFATRLFFRRVLSRGLLHSVRDMHTYEHMKEIIPNVVYTACPTMWMLDRQRCRQIPVRKARHAVFAVTYYRPAPEHDRAVFNLLQRHYETVYFWPQQAQDTQYLRDIGVTGFVPIPPEIREYDRLLQEVDVDFVGARLHGGIRALQHRRRALIIPVDNRAAEISVSTDLPVASRTDAEAIEQWILNPKPTILTLPTAAIEEWKSQFVVDEEMAPNLAGAVR